MKLPSFNTTIQELSLLQDKWSALIEPILSKPSNQRVILKSVALAMGVNSVNHHLGRKLQGWNVSRYRGAFAEIYDKQDQNQMPDLTLLLVSSAAVTVDLEVF